MGAVPATVLRHRRAVDVVVALVLVWAVVDMVQLGEPLLPGLSMIACCGVGIWLRDLHPVALLAVPAAIAVHGLALGLFPNNSMTTMLLLFAAAWMFGRRTTIPTAMVGAFAWLVACLVLAPLYEVDQPAQVTDVLYPLGYAWGALGGGVAVGWADLRARRFATASAAVQTDLDRRRTDAVEEERRRIASELNDIVLQTVGVMQVEVGAAQVAMEQGQIAEAEDRLVALEDTGRAALQDLRRMLGLLRRDQRDPALDAPTGIGSLGRLQSRCAERGMQVEVRVDGDVQRLSAAVDLAAGRIIARILDLAIAAGSGSATVVVFVGNDRLHLQVHPDIPVSDRLGAATVRERAVLHGGDVTEDESGWAVWLPLARGARTTVPA